MARSPELERVLRLVNLEDAIEMTFESCRFPLNVEEVVVENAVGRVLAEDIIAKVDMPRFDQAFYDGYAVSSRDTGKATPRGPVKLKIVGRLGTNDTPDSLSLRDGEAAFVPCGAPLPKGADAVIRVEEAIVEDGALVVRRRVKPGENVVSRGSDFRAGELLLKRGWVLRPQDLGLLMELGITSIKVIRTPSIGIFSVGSDLIERAEMGIPYPDTYSRVVAMFLSALGMRVRYYGIVPDELSTIESVIRTSTSQNEVTLIVGGVSVARNDLVPRVVSEIGEIVFHGVRVSPGKVSGLARVDGKPVFLVPGHIGSTLACLFLFVIPALSYRLTGVKDPYIKVRAALEGGIEGRHGRHAFRTVALRYQDGKYKAIPVRKHMGGSPLITSVTHADGFIVLEPGYEVSAGSLVEVRLFPKISAPRIYW